MTSTTKANSNENIAAYIFFAASLFLYTILYFDPSSSTEMVSYSLNIITIAVSAAVFLPALIYCIRHSFGKFQIKILAAAFFVFCGSILFKFVRQTAAVFMIYGLFVTAVIAVYLLVTGKMDSKKAAILIISGGCVMIIGCGMAMPVSLNLHDYNFGTNISEGYGHSDYIGYIAQNYSLPDNNISQKYHPPLHHILGAVYYWLTQFLGFSYMRFVESFQFVTCMYSCLSLIVWYKIFREMKLDGGALLIPLAILAFHPTGWIAGGCLNNDMLMWLLVAVCILYLMKWYKNPTFKNILIIAVTLGLGMMTKISAVMLAPAIAFVFLYKLVTEKNRRRVHIFQYMSFGIISIPLGMWYPIRNLLKFSQSFAHVPRMGNDSIQYIGDHPFVSRLFSFPSSQFDSPFVQWNGVDFNFFVKVQKTALFGENPWLTEADPYSLLAGILAILNYALVIISVAAIIYVLIKTRQSKSFIPLAALGIYYLTLTVSHIFFAYQFPFQCTDDVRYVIANIGIGLFFTGKMIQISRQGYKSDYINQIKIPKIVPLAVLFSFFSVLIFILDAFYREF